MARSNAERQAAYRNRRATAGDNGERKISTWVSTGVKLALGRLATRYAVTEREMLERLIAEADREIIQGLADIELDDYLALRRNNKAK